MSNRIADAVIQIEAKLAELNGVGLNGQPLSELDVSLPFDEFVAFQNAQTSAFAMGRINSDEAQYIYSALGGEMHHSGDGWPRKTSMATKVAVTKICAELMGVG